MTEDGPVKESIAGPGAADGEKKTSTGSRAGRENWTGDLILPHTARQVFLWILLLLCFLAAVQFYFTAQDLIRTWVNEPYIPFANAVFYLAVIIGSIIAIRQWLVSK